MKDYLIYGLIDPITQELRYDLYYSSCKSCRKIQRAGEYARAMNGRRMTNE